MLAYVRLGQQVALHEHIQSAPAQPQAARAEKDTYCEAQAPGAQHVPLCMGSCSRQGFTAPAGMPRKEERLINKAAAMAPAIEQFMPSYRDLAASSPWVCCGPSPLPEGPPGTVRWRT